MLAVKNELDLDTYVVNPRLPAALHRAISPLARVAAKSPSVPPAPCQACPTTSGDPSAMAYHATAPQQAPLQQHPRQQQPGPKHQPHHLRCRKTPPARHQASPLEHLWSKHPLRAGHPLGLRPTSPPLCNGSVLLLWGQSKATRPSGSPLLGLPVTSHDCHPQSMEPPSPSHPKPIARAAPASGWPPPALLRPPEAPSELASMCSGRSPRAACVCFS